MPSYDDRRAALLNILLVKFKEEVFFRIPGMQESMQDASQEEQDRAYFALRAQLQKQVDMTIQWSAIGGGLSGGNSGANILPEDAQNGDDAINFGQDFGFGDQQDYEAFVAWRAKGKGKGKGGKDSKGKGKGKDPICINCAEKGHTIANCPKPAVPMKDRPCLRCRKTGHMA